MIVKGILTLFFLFFVPVTVGCLVLQWKKDYGFAEAFVSGYLCMFALSEILTVPMIYIKVSFQLLLAVYGGILLSLSLAGTWFLCMRRIPELMQEKSLKLQIFQKSRQILSDGRFFVAALPLIILQMTTIVLWHRPDADDCFFVAAATTDIFDNSVFFINPYTGVPYKKLPVRYVFSPFPDFLAVISKLCGGFHPAIMAHTILPPVFMLLAYFVHALFAKKWFPDDKKKQGIYLFFISLLISFSCVSVYNTGVFQMTRIWQGKALLACAVLPALVFFAMDFLILDNGPVLFLVMGSLACCALSSMGILLSGAVMTAFCILTLGFRKGRAAFVKSLIPMIPSIVIGILYILLR